MKTIEDIKAKLCDMGYEESVLFENPDYLSAIVGISEEGQVIYSYEKMVEWLVNEEEMDEEEAVDFISYNTMRALPYAGEMAPIIMYNLEI